MKKDLKTKAVKTYVGIEKGVVEGYKSIETGVVKGYKAVENVVVDGYKSVETAAVNFGNSLVEEYDRLRQKQE
jgi:hypothetical protein